METENTVVQPLLTKQYHIPFAMFRDAFAAFQKQYVYPRTYVMMALLLAVAGIYSYCVVTGTDSQRPLYCMIIMFCLVLCALQWLSPRRIRRRLMEAIRDLEEDLYEMHLFPEYLEIGTILPEEALTEEDQEADALFDDAPEGNFSGTRIHFSNVVKVTEYREFFIVYIKKSNFYVLPKSAFTDAELDMMRDTCSARLGKGFASRIK